MAILNQKFNISFLLKNLFSLILIFSYLPLHAEEIRIVSLNPAITEVLFKLGLEKNIVGVSSFSDKPIAAKKIASVGSYVKPSIEKILRLRPTHVLLFKEGDASIGESLKKSELNYIIFESRSLENFEALVKKLGTLFKVEKKSEELITAWHVGWDRLKDFKKISKTVMIQVDHNPIFIAGGDTFLSKAYEKCGLTNIFKNIKSYQKVQTEVVMKKRPDIIIVLSRLNKIDSFLDVVNFWKKNPATKDARIVKVDADEQSRLSLRLPDTIIKTCSEIKNR